MIIGILLLFAAVFLFVRGNQEEREAVLAQRKKTVPKGTRIFLPAKVASTGLWIRKLLLKRQKKGPSARLLQTEAEKRAVAANAYGLSWCMVALGGILGLTVSVFNLFTGTFSSVQRPAFGETKAVHAVVEGNGETNELLLSISGRDPEKAELERILEAEIQNRMPEILGNNPSAGRVTESLTVPEDTESGIAFSFSADKPEFLSNNGILFREELPENGADILLTVRAEYKAVQKEITVMLHAVSVSEEETFSDAVQRAVAAADAENPEGEAVLLPENVTGKPVVFSKKQASPMKPALFCLVLALVPVGLAIGKKQSALQHREEQLENTYAQIISKLCAFLDAGMSIRMAWTKIADDYEKRKKAGEAKNDAFEEMLISVYQLQSGLPEREAYADFGKRCGQHRYMKLANLLCLNLKQGVGGLSKALNEAALDALEERKNIALRKGEKVGTKQLFPMVLMLGIVMVILIVPALLSF